MNWLKRFYSVPALVLYCIACMLIGADLSGSSPSEYRHEQPANRYSASEHKADELAPPPVIAIAPPETRPQAYDEENYAALADLIAQRWMAWTSVGMLIVTALGVCLIAVTVSQTGGILREAKSTTLAATKTADAAISSEKTTREIGEAQARCYVYVTKCWLKFEQIDAAQLINGPLDAPNGEILIKIRVENFGQTPAEAFVWRPAVKYMAIPQGGRGRVFERHSRDIDVNEPEPSMVYAPISGNEPKDLGPTQFGLAPNNLELQIMMNANNCDHGLSVHAVINTFFRDVFGRKHRNKAGFAVTVNGINGIPRDWIEMNPFPFTMLVTQKELQDEIQSND